MNASVTIPFKNSFINIGPAFFAAQAPTPVNKPSLISVNAPLADALGINPDDLRSASGLAVLSGNEIPCGATPISTVYAGHQFGHWNPQLGDGRAILLGEVIGSDAQRYDIQLKGAGPTPYSRSGDGRSPLGPVLREYIVSEAMAAMGVATTRSLAAVSTGEMVVRDALLPGAILTRVASSHIRVGTFQYFSAREDWPSVKALADHVIERHYADAKHNAKPYVALLHNIVERQARLLAQWQSIGFIHGVMNTDNMLVSGETVDYGPCAFMDNYHPETVFSAIDRHGRYAYENQPAIAHWNLAWLAQSLLPLLAEKETEAVALAQQALDSFKDSYQQAFDTAMHKKIGFTEISTESVGLLDALLKLMAEHAIDYTLCFRALADVMPVDKTNLQAVTALYALPEPLKPWVETWLASLRASENLSASQALMYAHNPVFIPRNHLVEELIMKATHENDFSPFHALLKVLEKPYHFDEDKKEFAAPPQADQIVTQTFCGT